MLDQFQYDVFLSHSSKDKVVVRPVTERLPKDGCIIPLRPDNAPIKGSLSQSIFIKWLPADHEQTYAKLFDACQPPVKPSVTASLVMEEHSQTEVPVLC